MGTFLRALGSSVGRKYVVAVTGLSMIGFLIVHLAGNLLLLAPDGKKFNLYAHNLEELGSLLKIAEIGLVVIFVLHIINAVFLALASRAARPIGYAVERTKGGPSKSTFASRYMIITGAILLLFVILHILHFKFGPGIVDGYDAKTEVGTIRDLHKLVVESFSDPIIVTLYTVCMGILALHLRHGFWSLFQSLGIAFPKISARLYQVALVFSALLASGFILIPLWIYFDLGGTR